VGAARLLLEAQDAGEVGRLDRSAGDDPLRLLPVVGRGRHRLPVRAVEELAVVEDAQPADRGFGRRLLAASSPEDVPEVPLRGGAGGWRKGPAARPGPAAAAGRDGDPASTASGGGGRRPRTDRRPPPPRPRRRTSGGSRPGA